jgi:hypothetical protein
MTQEITPNLGLVIDSNLTPTAKQNLRKIDELAGKLNVLDNSVVLFQSESGIVMNPATFFQVGIPGGNVTNYDIFADNITLTGTSTINGLVYDYINLNFAGGSLTLIPDYSTVIANHPDVAAATAHIINTSNPHSTTAAQVGAYTTAQTDALLAVKSDSSVVSAHIANTSNPHATTAAQVGAYSTAQADALLALKADESDLVAHVADTNNPHATTAHQVGTYTLGEIDSLLAAKSDSSSLTAHEGDSSTHNVGEIIGASEPATLTNKVINADLNTISNIENADIKAGAGIVYSKLALSGSIVNSDVATNAAIDGTKINANFGGQPVRSYQSLDVGPFGTVIQIQGLPTVSYVMKLPTSLGNVGDMLTVTAPDGQLSWLPPGVGGGTVKISNTDTTADYLKNKLLAGTGVSAVVSADPGNAKLTINNTDTGSAAVSAHTTAIDHAPIVHTNRTALDAVTGTNTGDETVTTIKTKLGAASAAADGYLTSADWSTFNGKQNALGYTPVESNVAITPGTNTKITYDAKGLVTSGTTLADTDIPNISASKITSGTLDIARIPLAALERLVIVADQAARYALTTATVQNGDTVKQNDTGEMWFVVDDTQLSSAAGYSVYTAGSASSVPWTGVTSKPAWTAQAADLTHDGYLTYIAQAIGGAKTFTPNITVNNSVAAGTTGLPTQVNTVDPNTKGMVIKGSASDLAFLPSMKFLADYTSSVNARYATGVATGTLLGSAVISGGKLDCTAATSSARYSAVSNADFAQVGTIRMLVTPSYSGNAPLGTSGIFLVTKTVLSGDVNSSMILYHNTNGALTLVVRDSSGVTKINVIVITWSPVANTEYEFELNYDFTAGATRLFIDGVQQGSTITTTLTRSAADLVYLSISGNIQYTNFGSFRFDNIAIFNTVLHTSNFAGELPHTYGEQSANLMEFQDSTGLPLLTVGPAGQLNVNTLTFPSVVASRAAYFNSSKILTSSSTTDTELAYVTGVTSAIQTQLNAITNAAAQIQTDTLEPTGFVDPANIGVSYDSSTRIITITHSTALIYYYRGVRYNKGTSWASTAHTNTPGQSYWLAIDVNGNAAWTTTFPGFADGVLVASVYYGATNKFAVRECHGLMAWQTWKEFHENIGTYLVSGGTVPGTSWTANTDSVVAVTPIIDASIIADEDLTTSVAIGTDGGTYTRVHLDTGVAVFTTGSTFPYPVTGAVGTGDPQYNLNPLSGTALASVTANNTWFNIYGILVPVTSEVGSQTYRHLWMTGQSTFGSLVAAQSEDFRSLQLGNLSTIFPEMVPRVRISYRRDSNYNNTYSTRMETGCITYLSGSRASLVSVAGFTPTAHNTLSGRSDASAHPALSVDVDSSGFTGVLAGTATVQSAMAILDAGSSSSRYNLLFASGDWAGAGPYTLSISGAIHGKGVSPMVAVRQQLGGTSYQVVYPDVVVDSTNGDVVITSTENFAGNLVIL